MEWKCDMRGGLMLVVVLIAACALTRTWVMAGEAEAGATRFYFGQLTDTHFGIESNDLRTKEAVRAINDLPLELEFVAVTGDLTSDRLHDPAVVSNLVAVLDGLESPVHCVPGNHDILQKRLDATLSIYTNTFGGLISQQEYRGVIFLFVYTEPLAKSFSVHGYEPLKAVEERLKQSEGKPVVVFHHSPSVDDFYNNKMHEGWKKNIREQWVSLLNAYKVKAVIAGHFHRDEHHWLGDVPLYVSPAIAGFWGRQATYRIYEYRDGKIGYRTQYIR